jgi:Rieske Fe-S protein
MKRSEFLKVCGGACLGVAGLGILLQSCGTNQYVTGTVNNKILMVPKSAFLKEDETKVKYKKHILVQNSAIAHPVVIYRENDNLYTALYMQCTHQGNELSVSGSILTCAAHGSEFDNKGNVLQGPAAEPLKSFPVKADEKTIYIDLA